MVGNAAEEGLLSQIGNPSHSDPTRVIALASFVVGGVAYLLARWAFPALTVWGGIVLGIGVCLAVAWGLARRLRRRAEARRAQAMAERRAVETAETDARIMAMRRQAEVSDDRDRA